MKLEPLQEKRQQLEKQALSFSKNGKADQFDVGFQKGIETSFETFTMLIEQYIRYKNEVKLLMEEQKPLWKEWIQYYEKQSDIPQSEYITRYNTWLFDYLFHQKHSKYVVGNSLFQL